jgi:hypothetical protein
MILTLLMQYVDMIKMECVDYDHDFVATLQSHTRHRSGRRAEERREPTGRDDGDSENGDDGDEDPVSQTTAGDADDQTIRRSGRNRGRPRVSYADVDRDSLSPIICDGIEIALM